MIKSVQKCSKRSFADVYGQSYTPTEYTAPQYTDKRIDASVSNVYVHNCVFRYCTSSEHGGALSCTSSVIRLLVEQSSFISCRASNRHGGGVYFVNTASGESVLNKICVFNCSSLVSGFGQFAYIKLNSNYYKNHVNDTSIIHSSNVNSDSRDSMRLLFGNILCPSVNITNNECSRYCTLDCQLSSSCICRISYNSIVNNTAIVHTCIYSSGSSSSHYIYACNILNNKQTDSAYGTFEVYTKLLIENSCILGNNEGKTVFYLGSSSSYNITISNCTFDNSKYTGTVIFTNTIENTFINALSHIVTERCDSFFDSYGTLTVKTTVNSCRSQCLMSCLCNYPMIDSLRRLKFMFLLTMLPSNPSNDNYFDTNCIFASDFYY
jgi:hypothetical protein